MKSTLLLCFLGLCLNFSSQAQDSTETFAKDMLSAIINNDAELLKDYQPNADVVKTIAPEMAAEMSDEDIKAKFLAPLSARFQANVDNIQTEIKAEKIDIDEISYQSNTVEKMHEGKNMPAAMSITFEYKDQKASIPVTFMEIDGELYVFEILISTNIFK